MRIKSKRLLAAAFAGVLAAPTSALATNGYFAIGYGGGSVGMGGIGVTTPQDTLCVGGNPACLGEFATPQFDMGAGIFNPRRRSATNMFDASNEWSKSNIFLIPGMGFVFPFNDQLSFGFAAFGNGGMNTTYEPNFFKAYGPDSASDTLQIDMVQLFVPITVSYKVDKTNTLGLSVVPARQRFRAVGLQSFAGLGLAGFAPDSLTNRGHDYANGIGARIGWTGQYFDKRLTLGATYASKVYMQKFELYRGLFAGQGSFDVPVNYAVGIAFKPVPDLTVALDVQKILYSGIPSVSNRGPTPPLGFGDFALQNPAVQLGADQGLGFGWVDQTVYKLGLVYKYSDKLTLRTGYNYGKSPIPDDQLLFNLLAPGVTEKHVTLGFTYSLGEQSILGFGSEGLFTFAYHRALRNTQKAMVDTVHSAEIEMYQNVLDFAYTLKF